MINQSKCKFHNFDTVEKYTLKNDYKPSLLALLSKLTHREWDNTTIYSLPNATNIYSVIYTTKM